MNDSFFLKGGGTILNALRFALRIFSGMIIFIRDSEKPAGFSESPFHGRGRKGKLHLQRRFLRKRGAAGGRLLPLGGANPLRRSRASSPKGGAKPLSSLLKF